jgi:hypothetical protein
MKIIINFAFLLLRFEHVEPDFSIKIQKIKTHSVFPLNLQKINKFTCGPMTIIDFSAEDLDVPVDVCFVIFIGFKLIFLTLISTWIIDEEMFNRQLPMPYSNTTAVPSENEISELAAETFPYLNNPILTSDIVNEEHLYTDYIDKINQYFNNVFNEDVEDIKRLNITVDQELEKKHLSGEEYDVFNKDYFSDGDHRE